MKFYCAMDVGGTSARLLIHDADGNFICNVVGKGCTLNLDGNELSEKRYRDIVCSTLNKYGIKAEDCLGICVAASGIDTEQNSIDCRNFFIKMGFSSDVIKICNDCEVFLLSSDEPDIIVISGTGSICVGRRGDGFVRCGGWGHIISDEGSAYILAVKIFKAVIRHIDEREYCPILAKMLMEEANFKAPDELNEYLTEYNTDRTKVACYAILAEKAANLGDSSAMRILNECAQELYELIADTIKKLDVDDDTELTVWLWGSVISAPENAVARLLIEKLKIDKHNINVAFPNMKALDAAMMAAKRIKN